MRSGNALISGPGDVEIRVKGYADDKAVYMRGIESVQTTLDPSSLTRAK